METLTPECRVIVAGPEGTVVAEGRRIPVVLQLRELGIPLPVGKKLIDLATPGRIPRNLWVYYPVGSSGVERGVYYG